MALELEELPPDVLILILTAVVSLEDLHALIRASPTLYQIFLQIKASTLIGICANQLGPATRDAIILANTNLHPFTSRPAELYRERVNEIVAEWRRHFQAGKGQWLAGGVSVEEAVQVVRINRVVQFLVDLYARSRFHKFEHTFRQNHQPQQQQSQPVTVDGTWSLSDVERHRLSQAFVRRQAILNLYCVPGKPPLYNKNFFLSRVLGLFKPWELEQISQADSFAFWLCSSFRDCEKTAEGVVPTPEWWEAQLAARRDATVAAMYGGGALPAVPRGRYISDYYPRLLTLQRRVADAAAADPSLVERLLQWHVLDEAEECGVRSASQAAQPPSPPSEPSNAASTSPLEAPWGWRDAVGDVQGDRWGVDLIDPPPIVVPQDQDWIALVRDFSSWRWEGFVFWDKDRIEALRHWGALGAAAHSGRLRPPWMQ
ncbi:hypothetical protein PG985_002952 [Apiospora marii]|uniref:uncharacterized protein n=1 Tax=Apiospora marii TaxID=335849 RepID=UPI00312EC80C